jgi:hypothetical protein
MVLTKAAVQFDFTRRDNAFIVMFHFVVAVNMTVICVVSSLFPVG